MLGSCYRREKKTLMEASKHELHVKLLLKQRFFLIKKPIQGNIVFLYQRRKTSSFFQRYQTTVLIEKSCSSPTLSHNYSHILERIVAHRIQPFLICFSLLKCHSSVNYRGGQAHFIATNLHDRQESPSVLSSTSNTKMEPNFLFLSPP